jgi:hypothetical protein
MAPAGSTCQLIPDNQWVWTTFYYHFKWYKHFLAAWAKSKKLTYFIFTKANATFPAS